MTSADGYQRSKLMLVVRDLNRWFFGESLLLWALAESAAENGHPVLSRFLWFVLWISAVGVFLVKCYPLFERVPHLIVIWIVASIVIAYYWFPYGAAMPQLLQGRLRFILPTLFTIATLYTWYRAFRPPISSSPLPAIQPPPPTSRHAIVIPDQLKQLRQSFELLAQHSKGLHHILIERTQLGERVEEDADSFFPEEVSRLKPNNDRAVREEHFVAGPNVTRSAYLYGDPNVVQQFMNLSDAAGKTLRAIPDDIVSRLPADIRSPCRMRDHGSRAWALMLHRLGWIAEEGSILRTTRFFWSGNTSIATSRNDELPQLECMPKCPKHRFYSVLGDADQAVPTDVCWASVWAIDHLLSLIAVA